jgi:hypothetical protein
MKKQLIALRNGRHVLFLKTVHFNEILIIEFSKNNKTIYAYSDNLSNAQIQFEPKSILLTVQVDFVGFEGIAPIYIPYSAVQSIQDFEEFDKENQNHLQHLTSM